MIKVMKMGKRHMSKGERRERPGGDHELQQTVRRKDAEAD